MIEKPIVPAYWPQQSPINIRNSHHVKFAKKYVEIQYPKVFMGGFTECDVETQECQFAPVEGTVANILFDGQTCPLKKLHFHSPSEHKVAGRQYQLEIHFVHSIPNAERGSTHAVIGVFLEEVQKAKRREAIQSFAQYLAGVKADSAGELHEFHPYQFLPDKPKTGYAFFRYEGSLTTQPYTEQVSWFVMRDVVEVPAGDLQPILEKADHPAREAQQISRRFVLRSFQ